MSRTRKKRNPTPRLEGEKLKELTGLSRVDMQYWNIDRLSTFQKTDIEENKELKLIFKNAGCSKLFNEAVKFLEEKEHSCIAENILKYCHKEECWHGSWPDAVSNTEP